MLGEVGRKQASALQTGVISEQLIVRYFQSCSHTVVPGITANGVSAERLLEKISRSQAACAACVHWTSNS